MGMNLLPKAKLSTDVGLAPLGILVGGLAGIIEAYFNPLKIPEEVKILNKDGITGVTTYSAFVASHATYFATWLAITRNIIDEPSNPVNYIPLALNAISGAGQLAYKWGKEDASKESNSNNLEDKVE